MKRLRKFNIKLYDRVMCYTELLYYDSMPELRGANEYLTLHASTLR